MTDATPAQAAAITLAKLLGFTNTTARNIDSLDFKEVSITSLLGALEAAYHAGYDAGQADADANVAA
jgi:hypothetical protein